MKAVCSNIRFVALSATIPNAEDIASWLSKSSNGERPATLKVFGEEYRAVPLTIHVLGYKITSPNYNSFQFDKILNLRHVNF